MPWQNSLVRANVPVFGRADAPEFRHYRLEFGEGASPKAWRVIKVSRRPQPVDPWAAGKVKWDPNWGAHGNLGDWETGLTSYAYGDQRKNLNGIYTLRLVVEDQSGRSAQARVTVTVARTLTREKGGIAESSDGRAFLSVPPNAVTSAFLLASIQSVDPDRNPAPIDIKAPQGLTRVAPIYELRPPGLKLMKAATLRLHYEPSDLSGSAGGRTRNPLPPDRLGIYAYEPVSERWSRLPGSVLDRGGHQVTCPMTQVTRHVAFYAIMADVTAPAAPTLGAQETATERSAVALSGTAEPGGRIEVRAGGQAVATATVGADGAFVAPSVPLTKGRNEFRARPIDPAGNAGALSAPVVVQRQSRPPRSVRSIEFVGARRATRGQKLLVKLVGEDASPAVNVARAQVSAGGAADGFELELTETGPRTGVYVAGLAVGAESNAARADIGATKHGQTITVVAARDGAKRAAIEYADIVPPSPPSIEPLTHPSECQETFQHTTSPFGGWRNIDGEYGAGLSHQVAGGNRYLKLTKQQGRGHMGAWACTRAYSAASHPLLTFDYLANPEVKMDIQVNHRGWRLLVFNDPSGDDPRWGRKPVGSFHGIVSDGRWHHAELNLGSILAARSPADGKLMVNGIQFINWDKPAFMKTQFGRTGRKGSFYCIDNFRILGYGGPNASFTWSSEDENGVAGYSFVFDREPNTIPPEKSMGMVTQEVVEGMGEGRWYLHVRAVDKPGNWGPANHYMVFVDIKAPTAEKVGPTGTAPFDTPVQIRFDDHGGSGANEYSVRLKVASAVYRIGDGALSFDPDKQVLAFEPRRNTRRVKRGHRYQDESFPLIFADGETVGVELLEAGDHARHPMEGKVAWSYQVTSPLKVTPANPDGENGWYVTPPKVKMEAPESAKVDYAWAVTPEQDALFRKGNSINRLTVTVTEGKGKQAKRTRYVKPFKLDTTVPKVTARVVGAKPGPNGVYAQPPTIVLSHDDFALLEGGLTCLAYAGAEGSGEALWRREGLAPGAWKPPTDVAAKALSVSWTGRLRAPETGVYQMWLRFRKGQAVQVLINGEAVLESTKAKEGAAEVATEVLLTKHMQPFELRWLRPAGAGPGVKLGWQGEKMRRREDVPREALFALRSLATIHYRWGDGEDAAYVRPLTAPRGRHVLHYHGSDDAGHAGPEATLEIRSAGP